LNKRVSKGGVGGFTLVEALIATAIMLVACIGVYELFYSGARTAAVGMWYSKSNIELRNGLRLIRDDLSKASYPSVVTDSDTIVTKTPDYFVNIISGRTDVASGGGGTLITFHMCKPQLNVAGIAPKASEDVLCQLIVDNKQLRYVRSGGANPMNKIIISDVNFVELSSEFSSDANKQLISIEIGTIHPLFEQSKVSEKTGAKVEVKVSW